MSRGDLYSYNALRPISGEVVGIIHRKCGDMHSALWVWVLMTVNTEILRQEYQIYPK
jgi:hypothetical protein